MACLVSGAISAQRAGSGRSLLTRNFGVGQVGIGHFTLRGTERERTLSERLHTQLLTTYKTRLNTDGMLISSKPQA